MLSYLRSSSIALILLAWPAVTHAQARIAPLVPAISPERAPELLLRFHDALGRGLREGGVTAIPPAVVRKRLGRPLQKLACGAKACARSMSGALGVTRCATARIKTIGKNYVIEVAVVQTSTIVASASERCDICTLVEALATTARVAKKVAARARSAATGAANPAPGPTANASASTPDEPGAASAAPTGGAPQPHPTGSAGTNQVDKPKASARRWPLWPALAAAGAGVVGLGIGIPLLAIDGNGTNCQGEPRPDDRNCQEVFATSGGGWVMTTMGLASLAASGVLFYLYFTSEPKKEGRRSSLLDRIDQVSFGPTRGGFVVGANGAF